MEKNWNYKLVNLFLNNTHLTVLLLILIVFSGILGFSRLRTEGFPEIQVPIAVVSVVVPGAGPETITETVTVPLENSIKDIDGIAVMNSSSRKNVSSIVINFEEGVNIGSSVQEIRNNIASVKLPDNATDPNVFIPEFEGPSYLVALTGEFSIKELLDFNNVFEKELVDIDGVSGTNLVSNVKESIYIDVDPRFNSPDLINQIKNANINFPLGDFVIDGESTAVSGNNKVSTLEDIQNIPISLDNRVFKLKDIANVYSQLNYGNQIHRVGYHLDNGDFAMRGGVFYEIELENDADIIKIDSKIKDKLDVIEQDYDELDFVIVFNQGEQSKSQIDEIIQGAFGAKLNIDGPLANLGYAFGGIWLLMIVILLFLDWRSAVVSVITIPLSFLMTFAILSLLGIQLNTIVLFSLVLVLGLIVDPAVVVLESLKRYIDLGFKGKEAALKAVGTVGNGIFIAVLTSFIVFIPFGVVSGLFGEIIKFIPMTVIPALIASYFIPMLILTWIGSKFLKPKSHNDAVVDEDDPKNLWSAAQALINLNRYILSKKWLQITIVLLSVAIPVVIVGGLFSSGQVKQVQFSQSEDVEFIVVSVPQDPDLTNAERLDLAKEVELVLKDYRNEIKTFFYSGVGGFHFGDSNSLSLFVELTPLDERIRTSTEISQYIQEDLVAQYGDQARAGGSGEGPPESTYPVLINVFSEDPDKLNSFGQAIANELETYEEVEDVIFNGASQVAELMISLKKEEAAKYGVSAPVVFGQLAGFLGESKLFTIDDHDIIFRIAEDEKPKSVDELRNLLIFTPKGSVKLSTIAYVNEEQVTKVIERLNGERFERVSARLSDQKDTINVQRRINEWVENNIEKFELDKNDFNSTSAGIDFEKSFRDLFTAIYFSIIITYIIFVLFFRSFTQPFIVLFTIPLVAIGVFPALVIFTNGQFGFLETLGLIMLIGIVENVGIFLIDFANQKTKQGMDKKDAIALSSGIRFRPIILAQLTSLMGLLPLAVFSPFWRGLAVVVISGIMTSGLLALITTPILYSWFTRNRKSI